MVSFLKKITSNVSKHKYHLLYVLGVTLLITYVFYKPCFYKKEHFQNHSEEGGDGDGVTVTFYAFDYCGYCKKFAPIWEEAKKQSYTGKVHFRYYEANTLSQSEKESIPHYVDPSYAPNVILTVNGKNIEFKRQQSVPMEGLDVFIKTKGMMYHK